MSLSSFLYRILLMRLVELTPPSTDQSKGARIFPHFTYGLISSVLREQSTIGVWKTWLENTMPLRYSVKKPCFTPLQVKRNFKKVPNKIILIMHALVKIGYLLSVSSLRWRMLPGFLPFKNLKSDLWLNSRSDFSLGEAKRTKLKSSTFWMAWMIQWTLFCFWVCWPGDLDMIGLQFLRRDRIWGIAHKVMPLERFGEGYDISDAWRSSDKAHQSV